MEGAGLEVVVEMLAGLAGILIYPILWVGKQIARFCRYMDPGNLPDRLTFDDLEQ